MGREHASDSPIEGEPRLEELARRTAALQKAILASDFTGLTMGQARRVFEIALLGLMNDGGPIRLSDDRRIERS